MKRLPKRRLATFASVGGVCLALQLGFLHLVIVGFGIESRLGQSLANASAFLLSTQVNFLISRSLTWRDRRSHDMTTSAKAKQHLAFNALAIGGLAVNQSVFVLAVRHIGAVPASALGTVVASGLTLLTSAIAIFPKPRSTGMEGYDALG